MITIAVVNNATPNLILPIVNIQMLLNLVCMKVALQAFICSRKYAQNKRDYFMFQII